MITVRAPAEAVVRVSAGAGVDNRRRCVRWAGTLANVYPGQLLTSLVDLLLPAACGGCGAPGTPWCAGCHSTLGPSLAPVAVGEPAVVAAGRYRGPLRTALLAYKERGRRDLATALAGLLDAPLASALAPPRRVVPLEQQVHVRAPVWLVPAPSRPAAARARGGDHVLRICRVLAARHPGLRVAPALRLTGRVRDSVGLDAGQRRANLAGRLRVRTAALPPVGTRVVLVDDVVTTGATLAACRSALAAAGVRVEAAIVLCDATSSKAGWPPAGTPTHCNTTGPTARGTGERHRHVVRDQVVIGLEVERRYGLFTST